MDSSEKGVKQMIERKYSAIGLCAILLLSITSIPKSARADNGSSDDDRPIHLYATASLGGPIGSIAGCVLNPGALIINGRAARDGQMIWAGDMLQSRADRSVPVSLDSVGEVTLLKGAIVKLATRYTRHQDNSERPVL